MKKTNTPIHHIKTQAAQAADEARKATARAAELAAQERSVTEKFQSLLLDCYTANEHLKVFLCDSNKAVSELGEDRPMAIEERIEAVANAVDVTAALQQAAIADRLYVLIDGVKQRLESSLAAIVGEAVEFCELHAFTEAATKIKTWHTYSPQTRAMSSGEYDVTTFPMK